MKIEPKEISIREVAENYVDDGDGGVYGLDGELVLRPPYQREYIYQQTQRNAVIDEKFLSIRAFSEAQKRRAYEKQEHKCAICGEVFDLKDMDGDHIVPWSQGGRTVDENLQMLCKKCNNEKSDK